MSHLFIFIFNFICLLNLGFNESKLFVSHGNKILIIFDELSLFLFVDHA